MTEFWDGADGMHDDGPITETREDIVSARSYGEEHGWVRETRGGVVINVWADPLVSRILGRHVK